MGWNYATKQPKHIANIHFAGRLTAHNRKERTAQPYHGCVARCRNSRYHRHVFSQGSGKITLFLLKDLLHSSFCPLFLQVKVSMQLYLDVSDYIIFFGKGAGNWDTLISMETKETPQLFMRNILGSKVAELAKYIGH